MRKVSPVQLSKVSVAAARDNVEANGVENIFLARMFLHTVQNHSESCGAALQTVFVSFSCFVVCLSVLVCALLSCKHCPPFIALDVAAGMSSEEFVESWNTKAKKNRLTGLVWDELELNTLLVDPPRV